VQIKRHKRTKEFVVIANSVARDANLSLRARGLLLTLLSLPDGWNTSTVAVARDTKEGRDAVRTAARELEVAGYLVRERYSDELGHWLTTWLLYDEPPGGVQGKSANSKSYEKDNRT